MLIWLLYKIFPTNSDIVILNKEASSSITQEEEKSASMMRINKRYELTPKIEIEKPVSNTKEIKKIKL